jgi:hypothetical protein
MLAAQPADTTPAAAALQPHPGTRCRRLVTAMNPCRFGVRCVLAASHGGRKRLGEKVSEAGPRPRWIWSAIVRLAERPADSLSRVWLVHEAEQNVHVSVGRRLTAGRITVPANVVTVRLVSGVQQRACSSQ